MTHCWVALHLESTPVERQARLLWFQIHSFHSSLCKTGSTCSHLLVLLQVHRSIEAIIASQNESLWRPNSSTERWKCVDVCVCVCVYCVCVCDSRTWTRYQNVDSTSNYIRAQQVLQLSLADTKMIHPFHSFSSGYTMSYSIKGINPI